MFKLLKQSAIIRESLIKVINKSGKTKKEIAKQVNVSQQSLSDWTTPHKTKPVTLENAQVLTDHFRDSNFTMQVIHEFFGLFKSIDSDVYRRDPSSLVKKANDTYNSTKKTAKEQRDAIVKQARDTHKSVVNEATKQAGEHKGAVDAETGEVITSWTKMKNNLRGIVNGNLLQMT